MFLPFCVNAKRPSAVTKFWPHRMNTPSCTPGRRHFPPCISIPKRYPPSVINLTRRVAQGGRTAVRQYAGSAVQLHEPAPSYPCGGDDLDVVAGDLVLTFATGEECYVPLAQPDVLEHPPAGEIIYMDSGSRDVFCRAWCWKNGDRSKLRSSTSRAAINLDMLTKNAEKELPAAAEELAAQLREWGGAEVEIHYLSPEVPSFRIA